MTSPQVPLKERLLAHRGRLEDFLRKQASGLARFDRPSDVLQDICARALENESRFEPRTDAEFGAWILQVARHHIADRHRHLHRLKRDAGPLLRISRAGEGGSHEPSGREGGPATFAERRELLERAMQALDTLPERDRVLIHALNEGRTVAESAALLQISETSAQRARLRAMDRFRRAFRALAPHSP